MDTSATPPPVPYQSIYTLLVTSNLNRDTFLTARDAIKAWNEATVGAHKQLTLSDQEASDMKFVDHKLTPDDQEAAAAWCDPDDPKLSTIVNETLLDGYRVTFTYDMKNKCIVVTLIGRTADCPNKDLGMTTRHGTVRHALHLAMYKHHVVFDAGAWGDTEVETQYG